MGRTLKQVMAHLPKGRRRTIEARTKALVVEELSLRDLRKVLEMTQTEVAVGLGKGQDEVSRIEQRGDLLLSTLHRYVESLGGELELVAKFKDRAPVRIKSGALAVERTPKPRSRTPAAR